MTRFVIDASSVLALGFPDERGPDADALIERMAADGVLVPPLWFLELANGLAVGERRGRIRPAESAAFIALVERLPVAVDAAPPVRVMHETLSLARGHGLTAYDAAYLELAMRLGLPLATNDRKLAAAAEQVGVPLVAEAR